MQELFPIAWGLVLGGMLGFARPSTPLPLGAALAVVLGVLATVLTGEYESSWAFVFIDIPLVALAAFGAFAGVRHLRPATSRTPR